MHRVLFVLLASVLTVMACTKKPHEWRGIPEGAELACSWHNDAIGACVGNGKAYTCIKTVKQSLDESKGLIVECARVSSHILPEEPKGEE